MLYASRTAMPLCAVSISKELGWDKTDSVIKWTTPFLFPSFFHLSSFLLNAGRHYPILLYSLAGFCSVCILLGLHHDADSRWLFEWQSGRRQVIDEWCHGMDCDHLLDTADYPLVSYKEHSTGSHCFISSLSWVFSGWVLSLFSVTLIASAAV